MSTKIAAVIGSPVHHSLSPAIHNAVFAALGDDWVYAAFEVTPEHAVAAIDAMRILGIAGLSVTMPHKEMVMGALDEVSPAAKLAGAVNTVVRNGNVLVGHNTDGIGCIDALVAVGADLSSVAVVGAGATARAVIAALAAHGARVTVVNRSPARLTAAVAIGNAAGAESTVAGTFADIGACATIVNTTPVGMAGLPGTAPDALPFDVQVLASRHTVLDAVYYPLDTPLVLAARARGANVVDGLDMLCAQARRQQELWLGRLPAVALMRDAALVELARRQG